MRRGAAERFPAALLLLPLAAFFVAMLVAHPSAPHAAHQGWWQWFDQSRYLDQARQMAAGAIDPLRFFYPPLYSALAAVALWFGAAAIDPFAPVDLICFLLFALAFVRVAEKFVAPIVAFGLFLLSVCARPIAEHWIVPWTTTPAATLLALLAWAVLAERPRAFWIGLLVGAMLPTRPLELLPALALVAFGFVPHLRDRGGRIAPDLLRFALGAAIPVAALLALDLAVWGTPLGRYYLNQDGASYVALLPQLIPSHLVLLWMDPTPYGIEPTLLSRDPWLLFGLIGAAVAILTGPRGLRAIAIALLVHLIAYAAYADLTPANMTRYGVVHYFKWVFPFAALLAVAGPLAALRQGRFVTLLVVTLVALFGACLTWRTDRIDVAVERVGEQLRILLPAQRVDAVEFEAAKLARVPWDVVGATLDGRVLPPRSALQAVSLPNGRVRLLFVRSVEGGVLSVPAREFAADTPTVARALRFGLRLGRPAWLFDSRTGG